MIVSACAILLLVVSGYANFNWFHNPAFTKDQWRELSQFLRPRLAEHEAVALVSGHAWPVWEYYASDLRTIRLPDLEILDVNAVIDFDDTAGPLRAALDPLSDRPGVWLVGWQDKVIDPTGVVPAQLEIAGREKGMSTRFWGMSLRRFSQLKTNWIPDTVPIEEKLEITFGNRVRLLGYNALDNGDLLLFWEPVGDWKDTTDLRLTGHTMDEDGNRIVEMTDRRLAGYDFPTFRWPQDRVVMGHIGAHEWLGDLVEPGLYQVELGVYDAGSDGLERLTTGEGTDRVVVGPIEVQIE